MTRQSKQHRQAVEKWVALYVRLSRDDDNEGDSNSIAHHDVMYRGWITPKNITS